MRKNGRSISVIVGTLTLAAVVAACSSTTQGGSSSAQPKHSAPAAQSSSPAQRASASPSPTQTGPATWYVSTQTQGQKCAPYTGKLLLSPKDVGSKYSQFSCVVPGYQARAYCIGFGNTGPCFNFGSLAGDGAVTVWHKAVTRYNNGNPLDVQPGLSGTKADVQAMHSGNIVLMCVNCQQSSTKTKAKTPVFFILLTTRVDGGRTATVEMDRLARLAMTRALTGNIAS